MAPTKQYSGNTARAGAGAKKYQFVDKDEDLYYTIYLMRQAFDLKLTSIHKLARDSGVSETTLRAWLDGKTRNPQNKSLRMVLRHLGIHRVFMTDDGTTINLPRAPKDW